MTTKRVAPRKTPKRTAAKRVIKDQSIEVVPDIPQEVDLGGELSMPENQPRMLVVQMLGDRMDIIPQGISLVEAPTILRLAAKMAERKLGLE